MTTAIVLGATGLTGSALVRQLIDDERFTFVTAFTRRSTGVSDAKFREEIVDFAKPDSWADRVRADAAFSCLGTTKKAAGSIAAQRKVDLEYQLEFAEAAAKNDVHSFILVSSAGANATSNVAYSQMKGELEDAVAKLAFARLRILRPGLLDGPRTEERAGERIGIAALRFVTGLGIARDYRPISVETVARAMISAVFDGAEPRRIFEPGEVFTLADA